MLLPLFLFRGVWITGDLVISFIGIRQSLQSAKRKLPGEQAIKRTDAAWASGWIGLPLVVFAIYGAQALLLEDGGTPPATRSNRTWTLVPAGLESVCI
jgi:hypothetical protein